MIKFEESLLSAFRRSRVRIVARLRERIALEAKAVAHAQHQGPRAVHPDAAVAQRSPQHREAAGPQD